MRKTYSVEGFACERCSYEWIPRRVSMMLGTDKILVPHVDPRVCPRCKSPYWNKARKISKAKPVPLSSAARKPRAPKSQKPTVH
jgi:hypothetical protein